MAYNRDNYLQAIARMLGGTPMPGLSQAMSQAPTLGGALAREAAIAGARQAMENSITPAMLGSILGNRGFAPVNQPSGLNLSNKGYPSSFGAPTMSVSRGR